MAQSEQPPGDHKPVVLAHEVGMTPPPVFGPGSELHWDHPESDPTHRPHVGTTGGQQQTAAAEFGPGSKVNWDNTKLDPNKRKHVGQDPTGTANSKLT
jgi:hypothetical protein